MKIQWVLFAFLLGMVAVVTTAILFVEEVPFEEVIGEDGSVASRTYQGHGVAHPKFSTMLIGGPGAERHEKILWLGWAFGVLQIGFFVTCLALGISKAGKAGPAKLPLAIGGVLFMAVFTFLILSYRGYMNETEHALFFSLPLPTAWMLYALWFFPVFFIVLYVVTFDTWNLTRDELKEFQEILKSTRAQKAEKV